MAMVFDDITHTDLQQDLAETLSIRASYQSSRFVVTEASLGSQWGYDSGEWDHTQSGKPRADVVSIEKSHANFAIWIWEIKVSRSDFLNDIRSEKWRSYLPFCNRLLFAAPRGMIDSDELPDEAWLWEWDEERGWKYRASGTERDDTHWTRSLMLGLMFAWEKDAKKRHRKLDDEKRDALSEARESARASREILGALSGWLGADPVKLLDMWQDEKVHYHKRGTLRRHVQETIRDKMRSTQEAFDDE